MGAGGAGAGPRKNAKSPRATRTAITASTALRMPQYNGRTKRAQDEGEAVLLPVDYY